MDIMCVGEMVVDFLPLQDEGCFIRKAGGAPANAAISASRCGVSAGFCGTVGDDGFGSYLMKTLRNNQVEILCDRRIKEAITTMAFVTLGSEGERQFVFARKPGADMFLTENDIRDEHVRSCTVVHFGSCSLSRQTASGATLYAVNKAKQYGKLVSCDMNYRALLWDGDSDAAVKAMRAILPNVDFLKLSEDEYDLLGGQLGLESLIQSCNLALTVITRGSKGALCLWNGQRIQVEGIPVKAVDTTGAGDAFWGAFLADLLQNHVRTTEDLNEKRILGAMHNGNIAGSLCVQKKGAIEALPYLEDIRQSRRELYHDA